MIEIFYENIIGMKIIIFFSECININKIRSFKFNDLIN